MRVLRVYWEAAPWNTVLLFALAVLDPLLGIAFTVATGVLVGSAFGGQIDGPLAAATAILVVHSAIRSAIPTVVFTQVIRVGFRVQERVLDASLRPQGIGHLEDPEFMDHLAIATGREWTVQQTVYSVSGLLTSVIHTIGALVILLRFTWWAPAVILASMLVQLRWAGRGASSTFRAGVEMSTEERRRAEYFRDLGMQAAAAKEIRVFGLADWITDRFTRHWERAVGPIWRERRRTRLLAVVPLTVTLAASAVVFVALARAGLRREISLTALAIYSQQVLALFALTSSYFDLRYLLGLGLRATRHLFGLASEGHELARVDPRRASAPWVPVGDAPAREIRLSGVAFSYPGSPARVFDGLDLVIRAGESLAIVGENGAGKTTLVKLLCRLYDPSAGAISVDGGDLREFDVDEWRRRIGVVFQDFVRYELSLRENVELGLPPDDIAFAESLDLAGARGIAEPTTVLSRSYVGGTDLSGGQWQKVALARALRALRGGSGLLILDEPTANLDVRAEAELFDRFLDVTRGLTTVLISHRFSTVRRAQRIVVLEHGRVVEDGSHESLLRAGGLYARMFNLQAERFV